MRTDEINSVERWVTRSSTETVAPALEAERATTPLGVERPLPRGSVEPYGRRDFLLRRTLVVADLIALSALLAFALTTSSEAGGASSFLWLLAALGGIVLFRLYGLYDRDLQRINHAALDDIPALFHALLVGAVLLWILSRGLQDSFALTPSEVVTLAVISLPMITVLRSVARRSVTAALGAERVVFLGEPASLPALLHKIRTHPEYHLDPVGIVASGLRERGADELPVLGHVEDLSVSDLIGEHGVDRLLVAHADIDDGALIGLLQECGQLSVKVSVLPRYLDALGPSVEVDDIEGVTVLDLQPLVLSRSSRLLKRTMDVTGAALGLLALSPVLVLTALAVWLDSGGPVLFRQRRIGWRGRPFEILKFRTMIPGADQSAEELLLRSQEPHWLKLEHDPRVTRVGRFLRMLSLDEVPQLWNVLRGEMSLVGPRPLPAREDENVTGWARTRLDLAPGLTGLWQVLGRRNIPFDEMVKLDTVYVSNWSLWLDIKLILQTARIVLSRQGAS